MLGASSSLSCTSIRPAMSSDSAAIARLFMRVWHISLKNMVPKHFLDQFQYESQQVKYGLRAVDPEWLLFVAESGSKLVGMIGAIDNTAEPLSYQKQIKAMYVDPDFQRQGIGTALLERVLAELKKQEARNVMLWCIKSNQKACLFYEKHGGRRIENITAPEEYAAMPHVIYAWDFFSSCAS